MTNPSPEVRSLYNSMPQKLIDHIAEELKPSEVIDELFKSVKFRQLLEHAAAGFTFPAQELEWAMIDMKRQLIKEALLNECDYMASIRGCDDEIEAYKTLRGDLLGGWFNDR